MLDSQDREVEEISIVTAVYNHELTLADTLDSILMQNTSRSFHVHCLNDASTDRSGEILNQYQSRYPDKISVYTSLKNQGSGKESFLHHRPPINGRYWCLLAGDDYWTRVDKLEKQVRFLEQSPKAVGCSTHTLVLNEETGKESIIKPGKMRFNLMDMLIGRYPFYVHPSGLLWRNIHRDTGFFLPPAYIESDLRGDTLLLHLMLASGGEIVNFPETLSCYRMTGSGVWSGLSQKERDTSNMRIEVALKALTPMRYRIALKALKWFKNSYFLPKPIND